MEAIIILIVIVFVLVWAVRVETGINKMNETAKRIEKQLADKKEKK